MAPLKPNKGKGAPSKHSRGKPTATTSTKSRVSKNKKAPPPVQQKSKPILGPMKRKKNVYTEKELGVPKLNMITPAGIIAPKGKKKGKVFIDDQASTMIVCGKWPLTVSAGEHDDYTIDRQRESGRADREQNDEE